MAILGGLIGAGVSMAGWYFLTMAEEREYGYAAWGVGILTGLGVRILARDASPVLAYIAAICAAVAILGGEFLVTNAFVNKVEGIFDEQMKQAQVAVKLQTDDEIRSWLKANGDNEDTNAAITSQDIDNFRKVEQPAMQKLLNEKHPPTISLQLRFQIFEHSLNLFTLLWLVFGVASAWRIAYG